MTKILNSFKILVCMVLSLTFEGAMAADPGVTDTEVIIGAHTVESGPLAGAVVDYKAMAAYFDKINKEGGVHGRKIKLLHIDTQGIFAKALEATKRLVEQDKIFAMVGGMGTSHQAAYKYLISKGVPDLFFHDLISIYGKPFQRTVFPYQPYISLEGKKLAEYAVGKFPGKKACLLIRDEPWSAEFKTGVIEGIEGANKTASVKMTIGIETVIDKGAAQANAEVLKLKENKCDLVFSVLFGGTFGSVINFASEQGYKPQWLFFSAAAQQGMINLLKPDVKNGIIFPTVYALDESFGVPGWKDWAQAAATAGIPAKSAGSVEGWARAEIFTEALRRAGKDLTREKIIKAVESLNGWKCGLCLEPLQYTATDHTAFTNVTLIESTEGGWRRIK